MAKHVFLGLTSLAILVMYSQGAENPHLALQYSLLAILGAFVSGILYGKDS